MGGLGFNSSFDGPRLKNGRALGLGAALGLDALGAGRAWGWGPRLGLGPRLGVDTLGDLTPLERLIGLSLRDRI